MKSHEVGWDVYISAGDWGALVGVRVDMTARRAFLIWRGGLRGRD